MSLSKLFSCCFLGSSQVSFDGQHPFSEKQHPLLLPTVLDTVFTYLTFKDLKSSRLVCKTWSEIAIPHIGRKKLKSINISDINFEDYLALKQELLTSPSKVKLFQGFELKWDEMSGMIWTNFLSPFNPSQLVISGRNISDLSTNLKLLQPLLTTLTHLDLQIILDSSYSCRSFTDLLKNFAHLQPMTLKILRLKISEPEEKPEFLLTQDEIDDLFRAFEVVFHSQSPTLEELKLEFKCVASFRLTDQNDLKEIQLPIFSRLQSLTLNLDIIEIRTENYIPKSFFVPFNFCAKFPKLVQLDILDATLNTMDEDTIVLTRGHPLMKKLNISEYNFHLIVDENIDLFENLYLSFPYIEELRFEDTPLLYLKFGGIEISWVDTLRILDCFGSLKDFNFGHLKKLEYLHYTLIKDIDFNFEDLSITSFIEMLLEHHRQLPRLKRFKLSYPFTIPPEKMNQILEALPEEFRAVLTFDSY